MAEVHRDRPSVAARALTIGVPCGAVVLYLVALFPLARVLVLDLESYLYNLQNITGGNPVGWLPWGRAALLWGGLPLFVLAVSAVGYRLARRFIGDPLATLSSRARASLGVVALVPWFALSVPLGITLCVWASVEVLWWIEWYGHVAPTTDWLLYSGPRVVVPVLVAFGGTVCIAAVMGRRRRGFSAAAIRVFLALMVVFTASPLIVSTVHATRVWRLPGRAEFVKSCHQCHVRSQTLYFVKTPAEWERTLERMADYEYPPLYEDESDAIDQVTDEEEAVVLEFVTGMRSFSDAWTFRTRCQRCHDAHSWSPRRPDDWQRIVDRHERWSPYYHRKDVRDQVTAHLVAEYTDESATLGLDADLYERAHDLDRTCSSCHALSRADLRYRGAPVEVRAEVIARMVHKMGEPLTDAEIASMVDVWSEVTSDPERFDLLFPHDRPTREGGLPW